MTTTALTSPAPVAPRWAARHVDVARWDYADAQRFLEDTWRVVQDGGEMVIATGEHPLVVTLGRNTKRDDVLDDEWLRARGIPVVRTERGGGATAHGPGQIVAYPVVDLARIGRSIPAFTDALLEAARATCMWLGVEATRDGDGAGLFVDGRKIASVGFRARRRVVTHGVSLNIDNDLEVFAHIATCGVAARPMTRARDVGFVRTDVTPVQIRHRLACEVARCLVLQFGP